MSKQIEALKLALEALEHEAETGNDDAYRRERDAIREALAEQTAQQDMPKIGCVNHDCDKCKAQQQEPVRVPVTDNTYNYAKSLAEAIFKQHFASDEHYTSGRIVWGVNDTVIGILTQIDNMVADMVRRTAQQQEPVANELKLHIIRKWPEGFQDRLQHVWLDVVSFIPDVKLYDLQRVLAEFGFTMKVYEGDPPASKPLTDEELRAIENKINPNMRWRSSDEEGITLYPIEYYELVRAIEAAHGIKGDA